MRASLKILFALLGFIALTIVAGRGIGALQEKDPRGEIPPCFEMRRDVHHAFRAACRGEVKTPGGTISLETNEDGLRDAARAEILARRRRVLVLGDSFVEGWWLAAPDTVAARLGEIFGAYFVNGGLRSTGPVLQARMLERLLPLYRPEKILWFVHDTDFSDDRLACATAQGDGFSLEEFEPSPLAEFAAKLWGAENPLVHGIKLEVYRRKYQEILARSEAKSCDPCRGFRAVRDLAARNGAGLKAVLLPPVPEKEAGPYLVAEEARTTLARCLADSGIEEMASPSVPTALYWPGDFHFTPEGMRHYVSELGPRLWDWLN